MHERSDAAVERWLSSLGLDRYAESFRAQRVDLEIARQCDDADLQALGVIALGDRKRLLRAISALSAERDRNAGSEPLPPGAGEPGQSRRANDSRDGWGFTSGR
jgi:hypothetical protein